MSAARVKAHYFGFFGPYSVFLFSAKRYSRPYYFQRNVIVDLTIFSEILDSTYFLWPSILSAFRYRIMKHDVQTLLLQHLKVFGLKHRKQGVAHNCGITAMDDQVR